MLPTVVIVESLLCCGDGRLIAFHAKSRVHGSVLLLVHHAKSRVHGSILLLVYASSLDGVSCTL